jgi:DNA-binding response OmpR family regulator
MKKVLIVEDDPFIRDISTIKLTEHGYDVVVAPNGETALSRLKTSAFDAVLLDLDLPDISGLEVLKTMRASMAHKETHVLIFSNRDDEVLKEEIAAQTVSGYYVKASTDFKDIFEKIDSFK